MKHRIITIITVAVISLISVPAAAYQLYFGDLHSHTGFSDGTGVPEQAYDYARNTGHADFLAVTDHVEQLGDRMDLPAGAPKETEWEHMKKTADQKNDDGKFVALAGFEWATDFTQGHINVLNVNEITTTGNGFPLKRFFTWVKKHPDALIGFNHPNEESDKKKVFDHFAFVPDIASQTIYVATNIPLDFPFYYMALDKGWHVAPSAQQDTHSPDWCNDKSGNSTAVYADTLTLASILDALRARRFFATNDRGLTILFEGNGQPMGSIIAADSVELTIKIANKNGKPLSSVKLITNGGTAVKQWTPAAAELSEKVTVNRGAESSWFVVLAEAPGERFAISAPVILNKK